MTSEQINKAPEPVEPITNILTGAGLDWPMPEGTICSTDRFPIEELLSKNI